METETGPRQERSEGRRAAAAERLMTQAESKRSAKRNVPACGLSLDPAEQAAARGRPSGGRPSQSRAASPSAATRFLMLLLFNSRGEIGHQRGQRRLTSMSAVEWYSAGKRRAVNRNVSPVSNIMKHCRGGETSEARVSTLSSKQKSSPGHAFEYSRGSCCHKRRDRFECGVPLANPLPVVVGFPVRRYPPHRAIREELRADAGQHEHLLHENVRPGAIENPRHVAGGR